MTDQARPLRIVLAEDSVLLREGLVRLFDEAGFETVAAYGEADSLLAAVKQWEFEPARKNGKPVGVFFTLAMNVCPR